MLGTFTIGARILLEYRVLACKESFGAVGDFAKPHHTVAALAVALHTMATLASAKHAKPITGILTVDTGICGAICYPKNAISTAFASDCSALGAYTLHANTPGHVLAKNTVTISAHGYTTHAVYASTDNAVGNRTRSRDPRPFGGVAPHASSENCVVSENVSIPATAGLSSENGDRSLLGLTEDTNSGSSPDTPGMHAMDSCSARRSCSSEHTIPALRYALHADIVVTRATNASASLTDAVHANARIALTINTSPVRSVIAAHYPASIGCSIFAENSGYVSLC